MRRPAAVPIALLLILLAAGPALAGWSQEVKQGNAAYHKGQTAAAIAAWERAVTDPAMPVKYKATTYHNLGILYLRLPGGESRRAVQEKKAILAFGRAAALEPGMAKAWNNRGNVYYSQGNLDAAEDDYTEAVEADPRYAPAWRNRSVLYEKQGEFFDAIADAQAYLRLVPGDSREKQRLARLKQKLAERRAKTAQAFRLAQAGRAALKKRQYNQALGYLNQALLLDALSASATARVYSSQGNCWYKLGRYQKAAQSYGRAIKASPWFAGAYRDLGITYMRLKNYRAAAANCSVAIKLNPKLALAWYHRGLAWWSLDDRARAVSDLTHYLQMQPNDQDARRILAKVRAGRKASFR